MTTIEIARRMAALGEREEALRAYELVLDSDSEPEEHLEAAVFLLRNGGDHRIAFTVFAGLYNEGLFHAELLPLMTEAFYEPNVKLLRSRYERNCKALSKYPYLFRKDFLPFDELPLLFFPYDDHGGYLPYSAEEDGFLGFVNVKEPVVSRNFFKDLDKPVLAGDVYSQYELEYLIDNVRPSEWVGRENHVYLHYTDWAAFCSWLTVLTMRPLLEDKKPVFLIGDELSQYPIDFKERFGIDYGRYSPRPLGIREINKLIFHTQLSSHNGGDFFNEIFDGHPNLLADDSLMFDDFEKAFDEIRNALKLSASLSVAQAIFSKWRMPWLVEELYRLKNLTEKDLLVAFYLRENRDSAALDPTARIAPAVFFQPHFANIRYSVWQDRGGATVLDSAEARALCDASMIRGFKYIKTFTPLRRPTTSYGGTMRYMYVTHKINAEAGDPAIIPDELRQRISNRSFMRDQTQRLYHDAVIVRFEDGKLNPKATFTALAAFLDIPYTESLERCTLDGKSAAHPNWTNYGFAAQFDTASVYNTYDEYANDNERYFIEYFLRDVYEHCGYDFQWYDGKPVDEGRMRELAEGFTTLESYLRKGWRDVLEKEMRHDLPQEAYEERLNRTLEEQMEQMRTLRLEAAQILLHSTRFINRGGQPLQMTPVLEPDPALLERERYH